MNKRYYEHTLPIIRGSLSNTYVEPLFLFPVDVWRDLGEWLLCVEKVCICESVKNVLAKLYALPEMEFLLHCNFPKNTLRWKYREIIFVDK